MKILYITSQPILINSSANLRNIALIKGLTELGHDVKILNMKLTEDAANYDQTLIEYIDKNKISYIEPIKIHNSMIVKKNAKKNIGQKVKTMLRKIYMRFAILDTLALSCKNVCFLEERIDNFDIIISSSDLKSSHLLAREYLKLYGRKNEKWIQYWGDPLSLDINAKTSWPKAILKLRELDIIKMADKIVYVSPYTLENQKKLFPTQKNKMAFVPIAYIKEIRSEYKKYEKKLTFSYFGDYMSSSRNILPLVSAIKGLEMNLKITGNSDIVLNHEKNLEISKRKSYEEIKKDEYNTDVFICLCNSSGTQIPGKIYHYSAYNKPILIIRDGDMLIDNYLKKYDTEKKFIYCDNNIISIREKLCYIIENYSGLETNALESFSSKSIAKSFLIEIGEKDGEN